MQERSVILVKNTNYYGIAFVLLLLLLLAGSSACSESEVNGEQNDGDQQSDGDADSELEAEPEEEIAPQPFDYCEPGMSPDEDCWASKRDPESEYIALARSIADRQLELSNPEELAWDWGEAVLMLGLAGLYHVTGEDNYLDFIKIWMDHHIEAGYEIISSDSCAPAALALELYKAKGDEKYLMVVEDALHYLYEEALRTPEGGLNHMGTWDGVGLALWVDSLFMFGNVLTSWGENADDEEALGEYAAQFDIFTTLLQKEIGFYKHATNETIFTQEEGVFWGRGNGWVMAAGYDHLRVRRNRGEEQSAIRAALQKMVDAAVEYQDQDSGLWWTVMNRPGETYLETSVAALFAFGLARGYRYGYQEESILPVIAKAMQGVLSRVEESENGPVVKGVSGPTNPGTLESYNKVKQVDDISYGVGAVLLALIEASGLPEGE